MTGYVFQSVGTASSNGTGTDFTANMPATFSAGSLLLGVSKARAITEIFTQPAGWTTLLTVNSLVIFAKIAAGSDAAPTISWDGATHVFCQIAAFNGDVYTGGLGSIVAHSSTDTGTGVDIPAPALTVTTDDCMVVTAGTHNKTATSNGTTITGLPAYSTIATNTGSGTSFHSAWGYVQQTSAANVTLDFWNTSVPTESLARASHTFALRTTPTVVYPIPPGSKQTFVNDIYLQF